jgi:hypothetical protein
MSKYAILFLILMSFAVSSYADVSFNAAWTPPTTDTAGNAGTPDNHILYVCNQAITSQYSATNPNCSQPVAVCSGQMQSYTVATGASFSGSYTSSATSGTLYARVTARRGLTQDFNSNCPAGSFLESDLSNGAQMTWPAIVPMNPPTGFSIQRQ